jgi:hypothetical protein
MISYSDEIRGVSAPEGWSGSYELSERLRDIQTTFGDTVHQSGRADYLVRFLVNYPVGQFERIANAFFVVATDSEITIMTSFEYGELETVERLAYDEAWQDGVVEAFTAFRTRIAP